MLRLNNNIYSQLNRNIYYNFRSQQLKLIQSLNNLAKRSLNNNSSSDSISIDTGKQLIANRQQLSSLTEVQGKNIQQFTANNNVLNLNKGSFYKLQTSSGTTSIFTVGDNGNVYMPFSQLGLDSDLTLPSSDYGEISKTSRLISSLAKDKTAFLVRTGGYSNTEIKDILNNVGIKPGWFQVNSDGNSNKFYLTDNGLIYPEYQVEAERRAFNQVNWFKDGYTSNSVFVIEGKEYKLDGNGHLNVPEGVGCLSDNTKFIK
ncbi:hypothetical protein CPAST_c33230 [Clostridium pasteurianum DSM 525 = ATCC 6013]|uniref:Uncharacterized protein n=1 Tax=Clostridium pasteurianum DSM 525 = ATCC 6013 TaxID=1262449 RepID=A0A0H3J7D5_CLOPA|nr:hypothetical protein [Clostridium pasteurianum]AJA49389.1 hypothetical protein CPAST_c33230 [Clostridium pasteurianum DSM 525 = ATCC 6013]AJA53377.1 hypothetical protein CLPA_c33230 [Clostridium pasteurianum DSM 525 = ATCC 6013]AOZ76561.1 hypothetical protein AQ983_16145 [Clostridium pasteurianum DSM 525 = ATCC 6013]AOZ80358.1 hypothetical protein AQ984_16140 [Clostridium pasteurianum]ELP58495.1 hypothetical protein F502_14755 [Clostridium pasteurianum DSM 525 = ATCC 6013]